MVQLHTFLIWIAAVFMKSTLAQQQCTLPCPVDQPCVFGSASFNQDQPTNFSGSFSFHQNTSVNGQHCACNHGWTGVLCDVPFASCDGGTHACYHGGQCVPGLLDDYGNNQLFCNCDNAIDSRGIAYVGKYCEHSVQTYCDQKLTQYCLNFGECNQGYPATGNPCFCPQGYDGEHCEYKKGSIECTLACQNGGNCTVGEKPTRISNTSTYWPVNKTDNQYCSCPEGYDGELCEVEAIPCGNHHCYNGGTCVKRLVDDQVLFHCDCTTTYTSTSAYAGQFCEYAATSFCTNKEGLNGNLFCVNGGQCQEDAFLGCKCPDPKYVGFSCEFLRDGIVQDTSTATNQPYECELDCVNNGTCRVGTKDLGSLGNYNIADLNQTYDYGTFQHCVCPDGFVGIYCEQQAQVCGDGSHLCLNGGKCVPDDDGQACDCRNASSATSNDYAGDYCQHPVNDICTVGQRAPGEPLSFCVNRGSCKQKVQPGEPHPGCLCMAAWTGPHCEISSKARLPTDSSSESNPGSRVATLVICALAIAGVSYFVYKKRQRRLAQEVNDNLAWGSDYRDTPVENNLSPRRLSHTSFSRFPRARDGLSSSRDPYATNLVAVSKQGTPEPEVYIGPPRDEDGHELHELEIA